MVQLLQRASEGLARRTSRRGLFGRGAEVATGALLGIAAGVLTDPHRASAGLASVCEPPGPFCPCELCRAAGTCAKPCTFLHFYASGCWATYSHALGTYVTCCDCDCRAVEGVSWCGCTTDYHHDPENCPQKK